MTALPSPQKESRSTVVPSSDPVARMEAAVVLRQSTLDRPTMVSTGVLVLAGVAVLATLGGVRAQAGISDIFSWGLDYIDPEAKSGEKEESTSSLASRECKCEGMICNCCVNFNVTFIDLGGPGCVKLKYLSQTDGLMMNVSYGDSVLHSEQVKASNPEPSCIDLLSDLAQVCARFTELVPEGDGLRGCVVMEPTLLGDVQTQYPVGCYKMGPSGMSEDTTREPVLSSSEEQSNEESAEGEGTTDKPDSEEALINAVNESAEEGIAWLTGLLGLNFGSGNKKPAESTDATAAPNAAPNAAPAQKAAPAPAQRQRSLNAIPV